MNMRTHHMSCLGMANPEDGKMKAHDITVIKRSSAEQLRNGAPKGRKVMLIWDIEKIFHQFKSKMVERKSWASSLEAKQSHAIFECLAHNLLLLFEQYLSQIEGLRDELEEKKQQGRSKTAICASKASGLIRAVGNFINTAIQRATQRTQRFIRWVRVWIYKQAPWSHSIARLKEVWGGIYS
jgi:hypothetical protein